VGIIKPSSYGITNCSEAALQHDRSMDDYGFLITSGASSDSEEDQHYYLLNNKAEIVGILRPGFKKC
jgi:hypothetical protein